MTKNKKNPEDFKKEEKSKILRMNGWYELQKTNNWVYGNDVPKKWKGLDLEGAFEKFYEKNKKRIQFYDGK